MESVLTTRLTTSDTPLRGILGRLYIELTCPAPAHAQFPQPTYGRRAGRSQNAPRMEILDPLRLNL